jgi:CDP-diacylglycerol---serine O-phosphatidyltransferase
VSWLMVSALPMMAMKFRNLDLRGNWPKYALALLGLVCALLFRWLAVPVVFIAYILLSLTTKKNQA